MFFGGENQKNKQLQEVSFFLKELTFKTYESDNLGTLQGTNISHQKSLLKMIFLFPRWDMLVPWRVRSDNLGSGFKHVLFLLLFWGKSPILTRIFQRG